MAVNFNTMEGDDFTKVFTVSSADGYDNPPHKPGTYRTGLGGAHYVFVKAAAAIAQYDAVSLDTSYNATPLTKALADAGTRIGFAQVAIASGSYGWVALNGYLTVNALDGTAANAAIYTTVTAGKLSTVATSQTAIKGIEFTTANASGQIAGEPAVVSCASKL